MKKQVTFITNMKEMIEGLQVTHKGVPGPRQLDVLEYRNCEGARCEYSYNDLIADCKEIRLVFDEVEVNQKTNEKR